MRICSQALVTHQRAVALLIEHIGTVHPSVSSNLVCPNCPEFQQHNILCVHLHRCKQAEPTQNQHDLVFTAFQMMQLTQTLFAYMQINPSLSLSPPHLDLCSVGCSVLIR